MTTCSAQVLDAADFGTGPLARLWVEHRVRVGVELGLL